MSTNSGVRFWLPLDAQSGPASRISRVRAASIIDAAMNFEAMNSQVNLRRPPPRRRRRRAIVKRATMRSTQASNRPSPR